MTAALALAALLAAGPAPRTAALPDVSPADYAARVIAPHRGRVLVVNFWATWCEPCRAEMPGLLALARELSPRGVDLALVSVDFPEDRAKAETFLARLGASGPAFLERAEDPQRFIDAVDPKWDGSLPRTMIYGRDGRLARALPGEQKPARLRRAILEVLAPR